jgi:hypothetical protein
MAHDLIVNPRKFFLAYRAQADRGYDRHNFEAKRWRRKDKKGIHFSASIFLPVSAFPELQAAATDRQPESRQKNGGRKMRDAEADSGKPRLLPFCA